VLFILLPKDKGNGTTLNKFVKRCLKLFIIVHGCS
jgi:hypothetical protein